MQQGTRGGGMSGSISTFYASDDMKSLGSRNNSDWGEDIMKVFISIVDKLTASIVDKLTA